MNNDKLKYLTNLIIINYNSLVVNTKYFNKFSVVDRMINFGSYYIYSGFAKKNAKSVDVIHP